jgi:hypothetical protein
MRAGVRGLNAPARTTRGAWQFADEGPVRCISDGLRRLVGPILSDSEKAVHNPYTKRLYCACQENT